MIPYHAHRALLGLLAFGFAALTAAGVPAQESPPGAGSASAAVAPVIPPRPNPSDVMKNWPAYPEALRQSGQEGTVLLQVMVDEGGIPRQIGIARSSNVALLDEAAVLAVRRWRFSPASQDGKAIAATVTLPINFRLKDPDPTPVPAPGKPAVKQPAKPTQAKPPVPRRQQTERAEPRGPVAERPAPQRRQPAERQGLETPPSLTLPPPQ
ncbi:MULTISPECIES: TonB family protein [unclassified Chelatococcus]|uniref:TonB family protein n=1 Tax=unclassified Chelatococcus TaxID=2638111 RepID=UPI001BCC1218|nr:MULTISPECIES: TonB family protein [unclassified Chelatococcus]MBS7698517.1 TonB family protein [Chelatococcus sp. YT9]MBX3554832.1 TonB family protein [Chelatococcus sp.]